MAPKPNRKKGGQNQRPASDRRSARPTPLASSSSSDAAKKATLVPVSLQQTALDVFAKAFKGVGQDPNGLRETIQKVKGYLYDRNFDVAFKSKEFQEAYCLRWSPSRTLAYLDLLCSLPEVACLIINEPKNSVRPDASNSGAERVDEAADSVVDVDKPLKSEKALQGIVCIGGGAGAELVAFAAAQAYLLESSHTDLAGETQDEELSPELSLHAIDVADWSHVVSVLERQIKRTEWPSNADRTSTIPLLKPSTPSLSLSFNHADVLAMDPTALAPLLASSGSGSSPPPLVTIFFTLNELYSSSMSSTTSFLLTLTYLTGPGTLLLVVDSPGSYSTVKLGEAEKKYPMAWMLDHTLLEASSLGSSKRADGEKQWEKLDGEESRWWRMDRARTMYRVPGIELEDMRMQWHLYRRL